MKILSGVPVLSCQSIDQTLGFYTRLLQFVIVNQRKDERGVQWAHLVHADTSLMLQRVETGQHNSQANTPNQSLSLYFFVDDIASLRHLLTANQVEVSDITETDYRHREMSTLDPEGNYLRFGQKVTS